MKTVKLLIAFALSVLLLTSYRTSAFLEYSFDWDKPTVETAYSTVPQKARDFIADCYPEDSILSVHNATLWHYKKPAYGIDYTDNTSVMFDKKGNWLRMDNYRYGLPECLLAKVPHIDAMQKAIADNVAKTNSKPWKIKRIETHPNGYLVKIGIGLTIFHYYFDKNGVLKRVAVEI